MSDTDLAPEVRHTQEMIAFLRARWRREAAQLGRLMKAPLVQGYLRVHGARLRADIDAKREQLDHAIYLMGWNADHGSEVTENEISMMRHAGKAILRCLGLPYAGEDGYKEDWRL